MSPQPAESRAARPRLGAVFSPLRPVGELVAAARQVEQLGLDELWVVEDCFLSGGPTAAALALASTSRLTVGVGLLPAIVRNPAIAAMELATLASSFPGRFQAAFGHGVESWMRQIAARPANRLVVLEEVLDAVRRLLHGERLSSRGRHVRLDDVALALPPAVPPPLLVGTTGARGIELARRLGDGLVLPEGTGPAALRALEAGRGVQATVYAWLRVDEDGGAARRELLPTVRAWRDGGVFPDLVALGGVPSAGPIGSEHVEAVAIAGTPAECAEGVRRLAAAGAAAVALAPVGADPEEQLRRFAERVVPLLSAAPVRS